MTFRGAQPEILVPLNAEVRGSCGCLGKSCSGEVSEGLGVVAKFRSGGTPSSTEECSPAGRASQPRGWHQVCSCSSTHTGAPAPAPAPAAPHLAKARVAFTTSWREALGRVPGAGNPAVGASFLYLGCDEPRAPAASTTQCPAQKTPDTTLSRFLGSPCTCCGRELGVCSQGVS